NPASLVAALEVLAASGGERWLVLGDMGELGAAGPELHWVAGRQARSAGVQRLYATGELSRLAVQAFGAGARHFDDPQALIAALQADLHAGLTVLIKGSRAMRMERVAQALGAAALSHGGRH
ncbi:MAG: UDP-N-acetylmuramoyl-tripeptide--D-alanyl-D-alanine ligase, partial [Gammaproteobacteria bacterium]|nr:UDP-N-acetylmuramoyl-tripeptide--D-alanyl-D-alanine ligase [Gammaproteobacteria bacterium]